AEPGPEPVVMGEVQQAWVEDGVTTLVVAQPDRLGPVVQDLLGDAAEVVERALVTAQERGQRLGGGEVEVARPRPAQGQHEARASWPSRLLEHSLVARRLATWPCPEADGGLLR